MWDIVTTSEYRDWVLSLGDQDRARLQGAESRLIEKGPHLGRPTADSVRGSAHGNMFAAPPTAT